ncbi:MAG: hypothetical protein ACYC6N_19060 [Pirellulaceae bacterium]
MNDKRLRIYLDDHSALMVAEVELIGRCWRSNRTEPLGEFLQQLENEVKAQTSVVCDVIHGIGGDATLGGRLKKGAAWFAEKLGRLKLNDSLLRYSDLSRLLELEAISAAALERVLLWDNLDSVAGNDSRLNGITFSFFRDQSQQQLDELNTRRRSAAVLALLGEQTKVGTTR